VFERFTSAARQTVVFGQEESRRLGHGYLGTEHLLLGLVRINSGVTARLFDSLAITYDDLCDLVQSASDLVDPSDSSQVPFTPRAKRVLEASLREALQLGHNSIGAEHIFLGMLRDLDSTACKILIDNYNLDPIVVRATIINYMSDGEGATDQPASPVPARAESRSNGSPTLDQFGFNLTEAAKRHELDPVCGRAGEIERVIQVLARRSKNNPILIGEPGVGKTAIVEGLAQLIASDAVPEKLRNKQLYSIDLGAMVAGARYRGDFEERLKKVLKEITSRGDVIVFFDEIHTVIGAGSAEGSVDAANMLKPLLARGQLQTIGATTLDEYRKHFEKDAALARRFQPVTVDPPSVPDTVEILRGLRGHYEQFHQVLYTDAALQAAAELSDRYVTDRFLPDKAVDLLDEAGSRLSLRQLEADPAFVDLLGAIEEHNERSAQARRDGDLATAAVAAENAATLRAELDDLLRDEGLAHGNVVDDAIIAEVLAIWTKIPLTKVTINEAARLLNLEDELHQQVIGQDAAVKALAKAVRRSRSGLKDENRPAGSFIFLGPSGVGKTELAKSLAASVLGARDAIIRLDMSEYQEKHTVSRLVGSPPGYVGYEESGQLTEAVRRKPFSVVLFDEIEKAHPDVFNTLLQILEDGRLTDGQGREVNFKNTFIVMTSNLGTAELAKSRIGFAAKASDVSTQAARSDAAFSALKSHFRPEFLNRIDDVIVFDPLSAADILQIVDLMLKKTTERLAQKGFGLSVSDAAKAFLAEKGFDALYGARPLRRAIQRYVEDPLSEQLLGSELLTGDIVHVDVAGDELSFASTLSSGATQPSPRENA